MPFSRAWQAAKTFRLRIIVQKYLSFVSGYRSSNTVSSLKSFASLALSIAPRGLMLVMAQSWTNPQKNLKRHWIFPVRRVQA
jgi:hypothetical protein